MMCVRASGIASMYYVRNAKIFISSARIGSASIRVFVSDKMTLNRNQTGIQTMIITPSLCVYLQLSLYRITGSKRQINLNNQCSGRRPPKNRFSAKPYATWVRRNHILVIWSSIADTSRIPWKINISCFFFWHPTKKAVSS